MFSCMFHEYMTHGNRKIFMCWHQALWARLFKQDVKLVRMVLTNGKISKTEAFYRNENTETAYLTTLLHVVDLKADCSQFCYNAEMAWQASNSFSYNCNLSLLSIMRRIRKCSPIATASLTANWVLSYNVTVFVNSISYPD